MFAFLSSRSDRPAGVPALGARVTERIAALPDDDQVTALGRLSGLMSDVRTWARQPDDDTIAAIATIDVAVRSAYRAVTRRCVSGDRAQAAHRPEDVRSAVEECLLRLTQTYLWLVHPWTAPAPSVAAEHSRTAPVVARGLRACTGVLKWTFLWHAQVPAGLWADACRLLAWTEAIGISRVPVRIDAESDRHTCIEREFLKGCMLATSGPERMSPAQVDAVERTLEFCADALVLSLDEDRRLRFVIDLEEGAPPRAAGARFGRSSRSLGINCYDVRLDDLIHRVGSGRMRASAFGPVLDQPLVLHTLLQVRERWSTHHH